MLRINNFRVMRLKRPALVAVGISVKNYPRNQPYL